MMIDLFNSIPQKELMIAAQSVSQRYRALEKPYLRNQNDYIAYLAMRLPGTLAAISSVLKRIPGHIPIQTYLDLGAGPGTGWMAAKAQFNGIESATLIEADRQFIDLGKKLTEPAPGLHWQQASLPCTLKPHDLVLMSYSLGEMPNPTEIVKAAWAATGHYLVLIEPGTPKGYELIMAMRDTLLGEGAHMVAPCPNALPCPMSDGDWCHFPARVERSKLHMQLKGGTLGYEDEKFSYLIVAKQACALPRARIISNPVHHKGHINCHACTQGNIVDIVISKRDGLAYKTAKKSRWGDGLFDAVQAENHKYPPA